MRKLQGYVSGISSRVGILLEAELLHALFHYFHSTCVLYKTRIFEQASLLNLLVRPAHTSGTYPLTQFVSEASVCATSSKVSYHSWNIHVHANIKEEEEEASEISGCLRHRTAKGH